ncbi:MAG: protein kinase [Bryobacterales bacterium]|nr:protein kinase [Bryobacterales bacterium]
MNLVEAALAQPPHARRAFLESAAEADPSLLATVWSLVEAEQQMAGFLESPLIPPLLFDDPFSPGQLLHNRFRITREVARGGMGIVYEAFDERLQRRIALKCAQPGFRRRLPPEVRNASTLSHPNICKIFELHSASTPQGDFDFLTMEFLEGETLAQILTRAPLPEPQARPLALQICDALAEAHRHHIVHGDLKAANIIVTSSPNGDSHAVITDFGLAHRDESAPSPFFSIPKGGTPDYMAPELWKGQPATTASDLYALGVLLRELLTGIPAPPQPDLPARWSRPIAECLRPDPAARPASATAVHDALLPHTRRWLLASAALLLVAVTGLFSWNAATAPREHIRLALAPTPLAASLSQPLAALTGNQRTTFQLVAPNANPTHLLTAATTPPLTANAANFLLTATLTDAKTNLPLRQWSSPYTPADARHIPTALAGFVTGAFHLPALTAQAQVAPNALQDYLSGLEYLRLNSTIDSALPLLQRAATADPASPLTHAALAEAYWWKFQTTNDGAWVSRSQSALTAAEQRNPDIPEVLAIAGLLHANAGRLELAQSAYLRALEINPNLADAQRRLGIAYQASGDDTRALAALHRAAELDPANHRNHQALGDFHKRRAHYPQALLHFAKTVSLAPLEPATHYVYGSTLHLTGRYPEAERELRLAIDLGEPPPPSTTSPLPSPTSPATRKPSLTSSAPNATGPTASSSP